VISTIAILAFFALPTLSATPDPLSEEALIEEVRHVNAPAANRKTHADPAMPGTFAELATPRFDRLLPAFKETPHEQMTMLGDFAKGLRTWESLPPPLRAHVEQARADAVALMQASRARSGQLPPGLTAISDLKDPIPEDTVFAAKVVSAEIRRELVAAPPQAVTLCVDAAGFARDLSYGTALGRMLAAGTIRIVAPPCGAALSATRPTETACRALHSIAENTAPLSVMFEQEKIWAELNFFGDTLSDETVTQLPSEARRVAQHPPAEVPFHQAPRFQTVRRWMFGGWARRDLVEERNAILAVADEPASVSDPVVARFDQEDAFWSFRLIGIADEGGHSSWGNFMKRWREAQATLKGLALQCDEARVDAGGAKN
jgi:hypothetical protein